MDLSNTGISLNIENLRYDDRSRLIKDSSKFMPQRIWQTLLL